MKTLDQRELATVRAALGLWSRTPRPSPHLAQQASGGDSFPPLDDSEVAELQEKIRDARVSMQPIDDDIVDFVREIALGQWGDSSGEADFELQDAAKAIVERLDD